MNTDIRRAEFPADTAAVETLFAAYLNFLFERAPDEKPGIISKYDPAKIPELVRGFASLHARPKGELLLARLDDSPVGCAMMRQLEPGIVEVQRVFVQPHARGHGFGKKLTLRLMDQARADGQKTMRLDTGKVLVEAIGLYRALGFKQRPAYHANNVELADVLVYFECDL